MSDELRAAAERLRKTFFPVDLGRPVFDNILQVFDDILLLCNEHPADDGEAVTKEWLLSIGFYHCEPGYLLRNYGGWMRAGYHLRNTQVCVDSKGNWLANGLGCKSCETRGDVRRLCAALGIELKSCPTK